MIKKLKKIKAAAFLTMGMMAFSTQVLSQNLDFLDNTAQTSYNYVLQHSLQSEQRVQDWIELVKELKESDLSKDKKISLVNSFWNKTIIAGEDIDVWGKNDYWATPIETLLIGRGDCEDYVLGKYITLLAVGIPQADLKLMYVKARVGGITSQNYESHMVLGYTSGSQENPLILDNMVSKKSLLSDRVDLLPVFSFNNSGVYVNNIYQAKVESIKAWTDFNKRLTSTPSVLTVHSKTNFKMR